MLRNENRRRMSGSALIAAAAALASTAATASAGRIYVWEGSPGVGGVRDGTTWSRAYTELWQANAAAVSGDEIWVAEGTYKPFPAPARSQSFNLKSGVWIIGGLPPGATSVDQQDLDAHPTILSGDQGTAGDPSDNAYTVIRAENLTGNTYVDGFIISGGVSDGSSGHRVIGGAAYIDTANVRFYDCVFEDNRAQSSGGAIYVTGDCHVIVRRSIFEDNSAGTGGGGAIFIAPSQDNDLRSRVTVERCRFHDNYARWGGAIDVRGGLWLYSSLLTGNLALQNGGAIYAEQDGSTSLYVANATIADNEALLGFGGGLYGAPSTYEVHNSIFWNNAAGSTVSSPQVQVHPLNMCDMQHNCIQDLHAPMGVPCDWADAAADNFGDDPLFVDPAGTDGVVGTRDDDYSISRASPCVDAGDNDFYPYGWPLNMNEDLAGADRIQRGKLLSIGRVEIIDVGAFEVQPILIPFNPADWNNDGQVDVLDLLGYLDDWFAASPAADLTSDGQTDVLDLLRFLDEWFSA